MLSRTKYKRNNGINGLESLVFSFYVVITMAIYILPYTKLMFPYIPVALLMIASLPLLMLKCKKMIFYVLTLLFATLLLFCIGFYGLVDSINDAIRNIRLFLPAIWGVYAVHFCNRKQKRFILIGFSVIALIIFIQSMKAMKEEPLIARILAEDQSYSRPEVNRYRLQNVGGYPFAYMMGVVTIGITWLTLEVNRLWEKVLCVIGIIACYAYMVSAMYTTLLILSTVCIILLLLVNAKSIITKLIILAFLILLSFFIPFLFGKLSGLFSGTLLSTKFNQLFDATTGGGVEALGTRPDLISKAIENWLQTPIFGAKYNTHAHSLLFETLQTSGIVGLSIWVSLYIFTWVFIAKELKKNGINCKAFNVAMMYFTLLSILNDTRYTFEITIAVFFIVPVLSSLIEKKEIKENF